MNGKIKTLITSVLMFVSTSFVFGAEFQESRLVDIGGHQLYIHCTGPKDSTTPTVILEGGLGCSHALWKLCEIC
jgi:hypothetical protein